MNSQPLLFQENRTSQKVFINSLPKSGTHLLISMLALMPGLTRQPLPLTRKLRLHPLNYLFFYSKKSVLAGIDKPSPVKIQTIDYVFKKLRSGSFTAGHIPYHQRVVDLLRSRNIQTIFVIRDPRDVVVSKIHYNMRREKHFLHKKYAAMGSDKERLRAAILGTKNDDGSYFALGIAEKLTSVLSWLSTETVMSIKFEDIIGPKGGGNPEKQYQSILATARHIGVALTEEQAITIGEQMFGTGKTFRKGAIGDWRNHFDEELKGIFKEKAGKYLINLGYEKDFSW
jgi:hypothetical protein